MLFNRHVWTDKRILLALPVAIALRYAMDFAMFGMVAEAPQPTEHVGLLPSTPEPDSSAVTELLPLERRIKKINLDGSERVDPLSPIAAAVAFGGAILLVGGTLSILSWRRAADEEREGSHGAEQDPIIRNAAETRTTR